MRIGFVLGAVAFLVSFRGRPGNNINCLLTNWHHSWFSQQYSLWSATLIHLSWLHISIELLICLVCLCQFFSGVTRLDCGVWYSTGGCHSLHYSCWRTVWLCFHILIWPWTRASRIRTAFSLMSFCPHLWHEVFASLLPHRIIIDMCINWHNCIKFNLLYSFNKEEIILGFCA